MSDTSLFLGFDDLMADQDTDQPAAKSTGIKTTLITRKCVECERDISFPEGTVSIICPVCVNCFAGQAIHVVICPPQGVSPPNGDSVDNKVLRVNPRRATKRPASLTYNEGEKDVPNATSLSDASDIEKVVPKKRVKKNPLMVDMPLYLTKGLLSVCRVCPYETQSFTRFVKHMSTNKHSMNLKAFKSTGTYAI